MKNKVKNLAYAISLINEAVRFGTLREKDNCIAVCYDLGSGAGDEKWYYIPKLHAAKDLLEQNAFDMLEKGIAYAKILKTIEGCLRVGILFKNEDGSITHCWVPNGESIQWESIPIAVEDIAEQESFVNDTTYNIKSQEFLQLFYEIAIDTELNCPPLNDMILGPFEKVVLTSDGPDKHNIFYFNPDSNAGGQIVQCPFDNEMAHRIIAGEDWIEVVAERPQYLYDINTPDFFEMVATLVQSYHDDSYIGYFIDNKELNMLLKTII